MKCIRQLSVQRANLFEVLNRYLLQVFAFVGAFIILEEKVEGDLQVFREYIPLLEDT